MRSEHLKPVKANRFGTKNRRFSSGDRRDCMTCLEFHGSTLFLQSLSASFEVWFREFKLEGFKGAGLWDLVFWGSPPAPPSPLTSHNSREVL